MDNLLNDARYALRNLRRSPGFAAVAVLTLGLGIGANTAIFTVAKQVLIDPLPYHQPDRIMVLVESNVESGFPRFSFSPPNYVDFRDQSRSFEAVAAVTGGSFNWTGDAGDPPQRLSGLRVTSEYFQVYGVQPILGRGIDDADDRPGADRVVVLNHGFWQRQLGGDPDVRGRSLTLNGEAHTVIGVLPGDFHRRRDVFVPLALDFQQEHRGAHYLGMRGRLAPGVTVEQADAEMKTIAARLAEAYPDTNTGWSAAALPLKEVMIEDFRGIVWLLLAAVGLVLLVACANVANLLLARMAMRQRELAVRTALGAGRWRLVGQFLTESTLLALAGGVLGAGLAWQGTRVLIAMSAGDVPRAAEITVDAGVLLFTLVLSLLTGLVFGLLPALQASRTDLQGTLKEGGRGQAGAAGGRLRSVLVVAEVAVAVVLLVGSGLLLRGLSRLVDVDPGFEPRGALTAQLDLPESKYPQDADQARFYRRLFDRLAALPGVERAGGVLPMPLTGSGFVLDFWVEGTPVPEPNKSPFSNVRVVDEDYFEAMKIPLLRGRVFTPADDFEAPWVAVINDSTAAKYFPGQDPIGQRLTFDDPKGEDIRWMRIVGVVGDVHHEDLAAATEPELYWSYAQRPVDGTTVVLRAAGDPGALAGPLRSAVAEIDPDLPVYAVRPLEQIVDDSVAQPRFNGVLWGLFAGLALLLAVIGVYGVISYAVAQRRREIGVRLALGAERRRILGLVLKGGMGLVSIGLAAGLALSVPAARLLAGMVYEIGTTDPATYAGVAVLLAVVGAAACLVPALRATRVDPVVVLREE